MTFVTTRQSQTYLGKTAVTLSDLATGNSRKVLTLGSVSPAADLAFLEIHQVRCELTTSATLVDREMEMRLENTTGPDVWFNVSIPAKTLAPSLTKVWQGAVALDDTVTAPTQQFGFPSGLLLGTGAHIVFEDAAQIDVPGDDLLVHVMATLHRFRQTGS